MTSHSKTADEYQLTTREAPEESPQVQDQPWHSIGQPREPQPDAKSSSPMRQTWGDAAREDSMNDNPKSAEDIKSLSEILLGFAIIVLLPISAAIFAAASDELAAIANDQSQTANQLALLSLCSGNLTSNICEDLMNNAHDLFPLLASQLYGVSGSTRALGQISESGGQVVPLSSSGGKSFIRTSVLTFWIFVGLSGLCLSQYIFVQTARWISRRRLRKENGSECQI